MPALWRQVRGEGSLGAGDFIFKRRLWVKSRGVASVNSLAGVLSLGTGVKDDKITQQTTENNGSVCVNTDLNRTPAPVCRPGDRERQENYPEQMATPQPCHYLNQSFTVH